MVDSIRALAARYASGQIEVRRHIHMHPELSFQEDETSAFIAQELGAMGVPYRRGYAERGIVAEVVGTAGPGATVALRADFDALPIQEENDVPFASQNPGVMHACGHDLHTAILLGVLRVLNDVRDRFAGTVRALFQPAEERAPGGAIEMIRDGALDDPTPAAIIGQHINPELPVGTVGFRRGLMMAAPDELFITVRGRGGHGAYPDTVIDPILVASHIVVALQQVTSRRARPDSPTVVTIGSIRGDGATNVVPDEVRMAGTIRTVDSEWRATAHDLVRRIATGVAAAMDASCDVRIDQGYPALHNDPALTDRLIDAATRLLGVGNVREIPLAMGGEDFAYFAQKIPGCFYNLGVASPAALVEGSVAALHTSRMMPDEGAIEVGMRTMAHLAVVELARAFGAEQTGAR